MLGFADIKNENKSFSPFIFNITGNITNKVVTIHLYGIYSFLLVAPEILNRSLTSARYWFFCHLHQKNTPKKVEIDSLNPVTHRTTRKLHFLLSILVSMTSDVSLSLECSKFSLQSACSYERVCTSTIHRLLLLWRAWICRVIICMFIERAAPSRMQNEKPDCSSAEWICLCDASVLWPRRLSRYRNHLWPLRASALLDEKIV